MSHFGEVDESAPRPLTLRFCRDPAWMPSAIQHMVLVVTWRRGEKHTVLEVSVGEEHIGTPTYLPLAVTQ